MKKKPKQDWRRPEARVNLYLPHEIVRLIDRQAKEHGLNRSAWIHKLALTNHVSEK